MSCLRLASPNIVNVICSLTTGAHDDAWDADIQHAVEWRTVGALKIMPKVCNSDTTSEAARLSQTQLMQMLSAAKLASILQSRKQLSAQVALCAQPEAINLAVWLYGRHIAKLNFASNLCQQMACVTTPSRHQDALQPCM